MKKELLAKLQTKFDGILQLLPKSNIEFWYARDLMAVLGYDRWENFIKVIQKAVASCGNSGAKVDDHFRGVTKMVVIGSGAERPIDDIILTRYACYLIAQNGDPRKDQVAFAQTYFAVQTRKQEIIEGRIRFQERLAARQKLRESETELSKNIYERGGDASITSEHVQNNTSVRGMLAERGISPEELPPEEGLKKLERRVKSSTKKMIKGSRLPDKLKGKS